MALTGLEIYKLLPKTNCHECGFPTCLAFAMQLAKKAVDVAKCPYITQEAKLSLEAASLPPIRLVGIGVDKNLVEVGNENVLFRHEEKFYHPTAVGFLIEDNLKETELMTRIQAIARLEFERVGQTLKVNLFAVKQTKDNQNFINFVKIINSSTDLALVLMAKDPGSLKAALEICANKRPLIYGADIDNYQGMAELAKYYKVPLVAISDNLDGLAELTKKLTELGVNDLVLEFGKKSIKDRIWNLTQIRRLSLKKNFRALGYPVMTVLDNNDVYQQVVEASVLISKYSNIIILKDFQSWQVLPLLTLRQNIYTDPQKPLQVEPKCYSIGQATEKSPVLVTTNFSLSYYTVLSEVESSRIPSYIVSVDTEGMSVLTAWAAEKFTPEKITESINKFGLKQIVSHNRLIIPGYVAVMSGDLQENSGWQVIVGPKEAAGIPSFLKNLNS